jgi:exodeoxyribonuclease VII small subunit
VSALNPVGDLTYEAAVGELETIVGDLDRGVIDVDSLSEKFQRAIDIVEELDGRIARTREKVNQLAPRLDAISESRD